jgi:hypothetical protein
VVAQKKGTEPENYIQGRHGRSCVAVKVPSDLETLGPWDLRYGEYKQMKAGICLVFVIGQEISGV